ncbi:MAG: 4a-hydroxytetrahydrobiopterin dehydratase [Anaerolineae bacterium]
MKRIERKKLSDAEINRALENLEGWKSENGKLTKRFKFKGFMQAMGWMVSVAIAAEKLDHHPEWSNIYNQVDVALTTHDMDNTISSWDVALAQTMNDLATRH